VVCGTVASRGLQYNWLKEGGGRNRHLIFFPYGRYSERIPWLASRERQAAQKFSKKALYYRPM
jgi:hypothetical protein